MSGITTLRPPAPAAPPGYRAVAVTDSGFDSGRWSTSPGVTKGRRCRYSVRSAISGRARGCGRPAAVVLYRGRVKLTYPFGYCADPAHLYGRWIEDGVVKTWVFRRVEP